MLKPIVMPASASADPPEQDPIQTQRAIRAMWSACVADVRVLKPGNLQLRPSHGCIEDAVPSSAQVASRAVCAPAAGVGRRIYAAVEATRQVVPCDTNLGILLLCAPLIHAYLVETRGETLRVRLHHVLADLTREDAELTRRAILLALPDADPSRDWPLLRAPVDATLREAMAQAAGRDRIAAQYLNDYYDVAVFALHRLRHAKARWQNSEWAVATVYLGLLARFPDTWLERRFGRQTAQAVSASAAALDGQVWASATPQRYAERVRSFDTRLRDEGFTPRTAANLSVATLLALRLQQWIGPGSGDDAQAGGHRRGSTATPIR